MFKEEAFDILAKLEAIPQYNELDEKVKYAVTAGLIGSVYMTPLYDEDDDATCPVCAAALPRYIQFPDGSTMHINCCPNCGQAIVFDDNHVHDGAAYSVDEQIAAASVPDDYYDAVDDFLAFIGKTVDEALEMDRDELTKLYMTYLNQKKE